MDVAGSGKVGPVNQVNHTSWVAVVTLTDRPKSVLNRCVIERFCGVVCIVTLPFWHLCWCRGLCHVTESDLFLFLWTWQNLCCRWTLRFTTSLIDQPTNAVEKSIKFDVLNHSPPYGILFMCIYATLYFGSCDISSLSWEWYWGHL